MAIRGRGTGRGRGRGRNPPQHSPGIQNNQHKRQRQKYTSSDSEESREYCIYDEGANHQEVDANNVKKCKGVSFEFSNNMRQLSGGIRHSQRRGQSDPPEPSQSCTSPAPPPPHMSFSPGVKNDRNERQTKGLTGADARKGTRYGGCQSTHATLDGRVDAFGTMGVNNDQSKRESQGFTEVDEYYADNDSEDEGMRVIRKRKNQQRSLRQEKTSMPTTSMPSSGGSHDRRKVISVEAVSNPRRFVPQTVTRDIISRVITRMPTPAEKWKDYPIETKDELFKDFIVIWIC